MSQSAGAGSVAPPPPPSGLHFSAQVSHDSPPPLLPPPAVELAMIMDRLYGGVCYAGIDTDPELKYPKGAGRVAFSNQQSYIAAISARFVQLQHGEIDKRVSGERLLSRRHADLCPSSTTEPAPTVSPDVAFTHIGMCK